MKRFLVCVTAMSMTCMTPGFGLRAQDARSTPPLFFMADLGDSPRVLEQTPRLAGELFKVIDEMEKEKKNK